MGSSTIKPAEAKMPKMHRRFAELVADGYSPFDAYRKCYPKYSEAKAKSDTPYLLTLPHVADYLERLRAVKRAEALSQGQPEAPLSLEDVDRALLADCLATLRRSDASLKDKAEARKHLEQVRGRLDVASQGVAEGDTPRWAGVIEGLRQPRFTGVDRGSGFRGFRDVKAGECEGA